MKDLLLTAERMRRLRRLSIVPRWTVVPTIQNQNVAEHTFHVAWLALWLTELHNRHASEAQLVSPATVMLQALVHDEAEALSGDIAAPYKKGDIGEAIKEYERARNLGFASNGLAARLIVKIADLFEALLFCDEEQDLGNHSLALVRVDIYVNLELAWNSLPPLRDNYSFKEVVRSFSVNLSLRQHPCMEGAKPARKTEGRATNGHAALES